MTTHKTVIGRTANVAIISENSTEIPAKVDTGADTSSVWASRLSIDDDKSLSFCLFAEGSPFFTGKRHVTREYKVAAVKSAQGTVQVRYKVLLSVAIHGKKVRAAFTLADRSQNLYPILIGRRLLNGKFLVDVSLADHIATKNKISRELNQELRSDPVKFFEKYHLENERGDINL